MPILPAEPSLFPEELFAAESDVAGEGRAWWVLHTRPRQEKALGRELLQARVPYYLPLVKRATVVRGRVVHAHVPLFTSYLFLLGDRDQRIRALETKRVVHSLPVPGQAELWQDLGQIHRLIASGAPVTPEERLEPGALVEIRTGPLAGLRGKILRKGPRERFVVQVNFIQRGASVELDAFALVAIPDEAEAKAVPAGQGR
jgi:transcriptional antiterminator RfaH